MTRGDRPHGGVERALLRVDPGAQAGSSDRHAGDRALNYQMRIRLEDYPALFAAGVLAALPPVVMAFIFQRYLVQGMLSGAIKG